MKLILVRHGESVWNLENLFTGWTDVELSDRGIEEAIEAGQVLKKQGYQFDVAYVSVLKRAEDTLSLILKELGQEDILIHKSWKLNERHYGALQGLNKDETRKKYGDDQVLLWRRSVDVRPPALKVTDERYPGHDPKYKSLKKSELPVAECLADTMKRVLDYWNHTIQKDLEEGKQVLVVAHGNSLRALIKYLDNLSDEEVISLELETGNPICYELDDELKPIRHYYLKKEEEKKVEFKKEDGGKIVEKPKRKRFAAWWKLFVLFVVIVVVIFGVFVVRDLHTEKILVQKIQEFMDKDLETDDFTISIKTSGDYATIEAEIKHYLKDLSDLVKKIGEIEEDDTFLNILTVENFKEYGPEFVDSFATIEDVRTNIKSSIDRFCELTTREYMDSLIERHHLDSYYVDLYEDLMYSESDLKEIGDMRSELITIGDKFQVFLDDCENILKFLKENGEQWVIENDSIIFKTDALLVEYRSLSQKLLEDSDF